MSDESTARPPTPPSGAFHSPELERKLLGLILSDAPAIEASMALVRPALFYDAKHRALAEAVCYLYGANIPIDRGTAVTRLRDVEALAQFTDADESGRLTALDAILEEGMRTNHLDFDRYLAPLFEKEGLRAAFKVGRNLTKAVMDGDSAEEIISAAQERLANIQIRADRPQTVAVSALGDGLIAEAASLMRSGRPKGTPLLMGPLDDAVGGLHRKQLTIVGARTSVGKTAFAVQMAYNLAKQGLPVLFFSLEMGAEAITWSFLCLHADVSKETLERPELLCEGDVRKLEAAQNWLMDTKIFIDPTPSPSLAYLEAKIREYKRKHEIGAVFIDYVQLLSGGARETRNLELGDIMKKLREFTKAFDVAVVALAQLGRKGDNTPDKVKLNPQLSDIRDSGNIEQEANNVWFLVRPNYFGMSVTEDGEATREIIGGREFEMLCVSVKKRRGGKIGGDIRLQMNMTTGQIGSYPPTGGRYRGAAKQTRMYSIGSAPTAAIDDDDEPF